MSNNVYVRQVKLSDVSAVHSDLFCAMESTKGFVSLNDIFRYFFVKFRHWQKRIRFKSTRVEIAIYILLT
jgi:hypothetical protein